METLFEMIINNLKNKNSISEVTNEIKSNIANGNFNTSYIILAFIRYLKSSYLSENNFEIFTMIERYFNNEVSLESCLEEIFLKKIIVDHDKRNGYSPQFRHNQDETFLDEIFRVIYEFTRSDIANPKGVCYDFCLFITGLCLAKNDEEHVYIWNSIEKDSGENNFILFRVKENNVMVYDPFNDVYLPLEKYDLAFVGFRLIELNDSNILKLSFPLTGFNPKDMVFYSHIKDRFKDTNGEFLPDQDSCQRFRH